MMGKNVALAAAALLSTGLFSSAEAGVARSLSDQDAIRLSYASVQAQAHRYGFSVDNAEKELRVRQIVRDDLRQTHVRLDQVHRGIPVFGEQLIAHLNARGQLIHLNGTFTPVDDVSLRPSLTGARALEIAQLDFGQPVSERPVARLNIHLDEETGEARLAYLVRLVDIESASPAERVYFIDAHNGLILEDWNNLHTEAAVGTGNSLYSGTVEFGTETGLTGFQMSDPTRGGLSTTDMLNGTSGNGKVFTDDDNVWGDGTSRDRASAGVDASFGAQMTWDFYLNAFKREGIRNDGKGALSRVHYSVSYSNAFWSDDCFCMTYGDGDGQTASALVSLDVAAHEMTHGVTSVTAGLVYSAQSGGLNESYSDIMGALVEFYASEQGADTHPDWWIGEDIWTPTRPGDALRYMDEPSKDGRSIDNAGRYRRGMDVHYSSGVSNNVFYLASMGGRNKTSGKQVTTPIGKDKAGQVFYRALVTYLGPKSDWSAARGATLRAAEDLYGAGSQEVKTIGDAWTACGVNR